MQFTTQIAAAILAFSAGAIADQCSVGSKEIGGNWYCQAVQAIQYLNVGTAGSYNQITNMGTDGKCTSTKKSFSGPLSPLDEEVSLHFRGPIALKQFASYSLTSTKKRSNTHVKGRRHGHQKFHERAAEAEAAVEERAPNMVVATIDGKVVSWENNYFGDAKTSAANVAAAATPVVNNVVAAVTSAAAAKKTSSVADPSAAFQRTGYYNAESKTLDGLTFLGNHGGAGSGVFDTYVLHDLR